MLKRFSLILASVLFAIGVGLIATTAPARHGPLWVGKAVSGGGGGSCGTAPTMAAAAGFTTCIANFDFTQSTGASWLPTSFSGPVSTLANWLDCTNTNSALPWHKGTPGHPYTGLPCATSIVTDPVYGGQVLDLKWLASYFSANPSGFVGLQTAFNGGTYDLTFPDNTVYIETVERQTAPPAGVSVGPNGLYMWGNCEITPVIGELFTSTTSQGMDGVWQNWNVPGCSAYHAGYTFGTWGTGGTGGNPPWNPPTGGWLGITHYTKLGMLITSDGSSKTYQCAWVNDTFQSCGNVTPVGGSTGQNYLVTECGSTQGTPPNQDCYTQYIRVWTCNPQPCYKSTPNGGTPPALTYLH